MKALAFACATFLPGVESQLGQFGERQAAAATTSTIAVPAPAVIPAHLSLDEALALFRAHGLDILIATARAQSAEGDVLAAGAVANPSVSFGLGPTFNYTAHPPGGPCVGCSELSVTWSLDDNGALLDLVSGKRGLRVEVARAALAAARLGIDDARRSLEGQVKSAYTALCAARRTVEFSLELRARMDDMLAVNQKRYPGVIDEGALARVEVQKLEADQGVAAARLAVRRAQVALAFLVGAREEVPDFSVDDALLDAPAPSRVGAGREEALLARAFEVRPDLKALSAQRDRALALLRLSRRQVLPTIALGVGYSQVGSGAGAASPPALTPQVSFDVPLFYQQQGEILRAAADVSTQRLQVQKAVSQVVLDVSTAYAACQSARRLIDRMQGSLLDRARTARDITEKQYKAGALPITDYLDAQRAYVTTNLEYQGDLASYWSAVSQLEQAVGEDLRK